jgi:large subunit ribosomal protein L6
MRRDITERMGIPDKVTAAAAADGSLTIKGPKGEIVRRLASPGLTLAVEGKEIVLQARKASRKEKRMLYTFRAHILNILKGVQEPYVYKLKACSSHFPMTVAVTGSKLVIKNFLGEKVPREVTIKPGVKVTVAGDQLTVESPDLELAGETASKIELATFISERDRRVFQDGIYMTEKAGVPVVEA